MLEGLIIIGLIVLYCVVKYIYRGYIKPYNLHKLTPEDKKLLRIHRKNIHQIPYYYAKCNKIYKYCEHIAIYKEFPDINLKIYESGYVCSCDCYNKNTFIYFTYLDPIVFESLYEHLFETSNTNKVIEEAIEINKILIEGIRKNGR